MRTRMLLAALLLCPPAWGELYEVAARVSVDADLLTLADLAPEAPEGWRAVALGRAPRPGGERVLQRDWVLQRARQVGGAEALEVPEQIVVSRPGRAVEREDVVAAVREALVAQIGDQEQLQVQSVGLPGPVPTGALEYRVQLPRGPLPSPATVWVDVLVDGERAGRAWVRLEVFRSRPVLVLVHNGRRGQELTRDDVEVRGGNAVPGALTDPAEALGKRLARGLKAGSPLTARDLETVPVVDRGDTLLLVARVGGVTASLPGRAMEPAGIGDMLRVESLSSGQTLSGVLRDGGVVEVTAGRGR